MLSSGFVESSREAGPYLMNILIVEDNVWMRDTMTQMLQTRFPRTHVSNAATVREGWDRLRDNTPGIVFVDIRLPDGNGLQLTEAIKERYPETRVVVNTSHDIPEYEERAYEVGADHFFVKPAIDVQEIFQVVEEMMVRAESGDGGQEGT